MIKVLFIQGDSVVIYCINRVKKEIIKGQRTAGKKAPDDIAYIIENSLNGVTVPFYESNSKGNIFVRSVNSYLVNIRNWNRLLRIVKPGDWVIIQHPYEGSKLGYKKVRRCEKAGIKTIVLIHDISIKRSNIDTVEVGAFERMTRKSELKTLQYCTYIICHNKQMKNYLTQLGIQDRKVFCLNIFDYICDDNLIQERKLSKEICIAGNLSARKSAYLYRFIEDNTDLKINLYGPNYEGRFEDRVVYNGIISPNDLPTMLQGSFGLVWDGDDTTACSGTAGEYLKINNPHKCSLYLASNLPVIIWEQAALAEFVTKNGIGLTVKSLSEISEAIGKLSEDTYAMMVENVRAVGKRLRDGYYTKKTVQEVIQCK